MKKGFVLILTFAFIMGMAAPIYAGDMPKAVDKLSQGTLDIITSPVELYDHTIGDMEKSDNKPVDLFMGLLKSPFHMIMKAGHGVVDVATFPVE